MQILKTIRNRMREIVLAFGVCSSLGTVSAADKPNVLWIYVEDLSPLLSCYGVAQNPTPTIDALAENGVLFKQVFAPAPVCSTSRSSVMTGAMATTIGVHNHLSEYFKGDAAVQLPEGVTTIPEIFKKNGYYTFNQGKTHYNFAYDYKDLYDAKPSKKMVEITSKFKPAWRGRPKGKPFFGQIQLLGGKNKGTIQSLEQLDVKMPGYYPEHPLLREYWEGHHDNARITDREVALIMKWLKEDGLLENTIVFFFSDHGFNYGVRDKQFCYNGGTHVPLIISWAGNPAAVEPGVVREDLVSGLDVTATSLALAGIDIPKYMESKNLFDPEYKRDYVISIRDRCDYTIDRIRAVRTKNFRYIRNFYTDRPYLQPQYRDEKDYMKVLKKLYKDGKMNEAQAWFFSDERPAEELYDEINDPEELVNLAGNPAFAAELKKHRAILDQWIEDTDDQGQYPEPKERLKQVKKKWRKKAVDPVFEGL
jgi:arylsulfatase A-like enzyme